MTFLRNQLNVILCKDNTQDLAECNEDEMEAEKQNKGFELTKEERAMLFEEHEISTSNALKAVIGYVPQDEKRICQHYDPVTGGCFKGNACRFEHVELLAGNLYLIHSMSTTGFTWTQFS